MVGLIIESFGLNIQYFILNHLRLIKDQFRRCDQIFHTLLLLKLNWQPLIPLSKRPTIITITEFWNRPFQIYKTFMMLKELIYNSLWRKNQEQVIAEEQKASIDHNPKSVYATFYQEIDSIFPKNLTCFCLAIPFA